MHTRQELGNELKRILEITKDIKIISQWAENQYFSHIDEYPNDLIRVLESLAFMSINSQFEYSQEKLERLSDMLINNEDNILEKV